jgi:hypothetical protein
MTDQEFHNAVNPKPCKFCGKAASYCPLDEMEQYGVKVYFCHPCKAEYLFWPNGVRSSISLYTIINHKTYRWTILKENTAQLWYVKDPGIPATRLNHNLDLIKFFNGSDMPELTPQNINDKIRTWLIFI